LASAAGVVVVARAASQPAKVAKLFTAMWAGLLRRTTRFLIEINTDDRSRLPLFLFRLYCCALLLLPAGYFLFFIVQQA
jgi:hypothetical protein